jgi:hypothetical protein
MDLEGQRFGRLKVLGLYEIRRYVSERSAQTKYYWVCICDCGISKIVRTEHLTTGRILSCGCLDRETCRKRMTTHGMTKSPEHRSWACMKARIRGYDPHHRKYYADVNLDPRWEKFENFLKDMGPKPSPKHEIDRINPFGNYEPGNCRWATRSEQMFNTRRSYDK